MLVNYLYYDVECIGNGLICTFGYVIVDSNFNIIKKEDIIINPNASRENYQKYVIEHILSYDIETIEKGNNFKEEYKKIKNMLINNITFGYDVRNDIRVINKECERYGLDLIEVKSYDIQKIYKEYLGVKDVKSLGNLMREFGIDISILREHNSCDDAMMTMLASKYICQKLNINQEQLIKLCDKSFVDYKMINLSKENKKKKYLLKVKELNKNIEDSIKVCFDNVLEIDKIDEEYNLIDKMYKNGFSYESSLTRCDYLVISDKKTKLEEACDYINKKGIKKISKITMEEFMKLVNKRGCNRGFKKR